MSRKGVEGRLLMRITDRIRSEEKLSALRRRAIFSSCAFGISVLTFIGSCFLLQSVLVRSELLRVLSLVFSDPQAILANWRDFGLFILESMPAVSLAGMLMAFLLLLISARYAVRYLSKMLSLVKRTHIHFHGF